jgi:hypothetical protein
MLPARLRINLASKITGANLSKVHDLASLKINDKQYHMLTGFGLIAWRTNWLEPCKSLFSLNLARQLLAR